MNPDIWQIVADEWRKQGMSDAGIAGVLANVRQESNFDPALRHPDQPHWGGEAHYAHGLYQEGGEEWNHYSDWLNQNHPGASWQDPRLQSEFAAYNLKTNYPKVWDAMNGGSPVQAGASYASGYLKPAAQYLTDRIAGFQRNGVPTLDDYANGTANYRPSQSASASPPVLPGAASAPTEAAPAPQPAPSGTDPRSKLAGMAQDYLQQPELQPAPMSPMQAPAVPQSDLRGALQRLIQRQQQPQPQLQPGIAQQLIQNIGNG